MASAADTPATAAPTPTGEKKRFSKVVSRMRTILRRGDSSRRLSSSSLAAPVVVPPTSPPADLVNTDQTTERVHTPVKRTTEELQRARNLAQKYNIDLDMSDWKVVEVAERVEKSIRMRIHRSCHLCNTSYGANKTCASCGHVRCDRCPRYPKKKDTGAKDKDVAYPGAPRGYGVEALESLKRKHKYVLTIPSKTGGQDLVMKKPMQRVRRNCHHCDSVFMPGNKMCAKCRHVRCVDCPRDPPKKKKYPDGYPGDAPGSGDEADPANPESSSRSYTKPKRKVRYSCHVCQTKFKPTELTCQSCGHEKCNDCPRVAPRKVEPEPDPEVVQRVQEKLKALGVGGMSDISRTADPPGQSLPEVDPAEG